LDKTFFYWAFYCVNDNALDDLENEQIMCCILCHKNLMFTTNPRTQARKKLISYYKTNGIIAL
jgi:hypothetical protein